VESNCPFCGKDKIVIDTFNYISGKPFRFRAQCHGCGAATRWHETKEEAWAAWNMRPAAKVPDTALFNKNLFFFQGNLYARNPQNEFCFKGSKRIKKTDYLLAYADCAKAAGKVTA
jgi:Lar family restriction alleviation protein